MKNGELDERQKQKRMEAGNRSFWIVISLCLAMNFISLFWEVSDKYIDSGYSLIVLAGILSYSAGNIREGIWDSKLPAGPLGSFLFSICFSGIFTIIYWGMLIAARKPGDDLPVNKMAGICFIVVFPVTFVFYFVMGWLTDRARKRNEEKYADE